MSEEARKRKPTATSAVKENIELKQRLQELEDTLRSIHNGDIDALVVNDDVYILESAHAASSRLRQDVLSQMEDAVFAFDCNDHVIYLNAAAERRYQVTFSDALGRAKSELFVETELASIDRGNEAPMPPSERRVGVRSLHRLPDGSTMQVEAIVSPLPDASGNSAGTLAVIRDVSRRWRTEGRRDALVNLSDRFRDMKEGGDAGREAAAVLGQTLAVSRVSVVVLDPIAQSVLSSQDWEAATAGARAGTPRGDTNYGPFIDDLRMNRLISISDVRLDSRTNANPEPFEARGARALVNAPLIEHGALVGVLSVNHHEVRDWSDEDLSFIRDIAERTRLVIERNRTEAALRDSESRLRQANENLEAAVQARTGELMVVEQALRQAQKMEAVGQLTGGIAHDFNNLLASISASLEVLQARSRQGKLEGSERYLQIGLDSVKRASALTQRLLAFARRQTLDPRATDLNRLIAGMEELIRRTVGPNVEVEVVGAGGLWTTRIDPSQLETSLLNLCINGRDAMQPAGGRLTIETANKWLDERAAAERELPAGQYVSLCVTDSGTGMSSELIKRVFDPFFTTKPLGQGTGLGLSMVYGFVRQSGGQVRVYSEIGKGTTMCLYLPRHLGAVSEDDMVQPAEPVASGRGRTVLLIEDEQNLRLLVSEVLQDAGYRIITAQDGQAGLQILQSDQRVDLLVTDVGLPGGMNGRQVADAARTSRPQLKVLFVTGFAENAAVGNGHLEPGMALMTKPFEIAQLARKVKEMIDAR